jgi:lysophospholipase L1-like esterase
MLIKHAVAALALATTLAAAPAAAPARDLAALHRPECALTVSRGAAHGCWRPHTNTTRPSRKELGGVDYYVSLGDSFSVGTQPIGEPPLFETDQGYADQLYALLQPADPMLKLVKLGCGGESTRSMRFGSVDPSEGSSCGPPDFYLHRYPHKTQLAEAVSFLHAHRNHLALVTIDIGGNDVIGGGGVAQIQTNLPVILSDLREAAGPGVPIVGMTYYDPLLPSVWFGGYGVIAHAFQQALP